jgi:uncharacterized protein
MERPITFQAGEVTLEGLIAAPPSARVGIVVCHPHPLRGGEMHNNMVEALVAGFGAAGFATLRFNFRGVGSSTGEHDHGAAEREDVAAAVTCLLDNVAAPVVAVAGYSFGAWVGLAAGAADPRVHRLVGIAPPAASRDHGFLATVPKPTLLIAGDCDDIAPLAPLRKFVADSAETTSLEVIAGADHFFWSREDEVCRAAVAFFGPA